MPAAPGSEGSNALRNQVEQLRHEASLQRLNVSEAAKSLMEFCEKNKPSDALVSGPTDHNPFQEKSKCSVL